MTPNKPAQRTDPFRVTMMIFAAIGFMYFTGEVLKPLALSVLLSFALAPVANLLERCRLPRAAAVILTVVLSLGVLGVLGYVVGRQLPSLAVHLPEYQKHIETKINNLIDPGEESAVGRLNRLAAEVTAKMEKPTVSRSVKADSGTGEPEAGERDDRVPIQKVEVVAHPAFQDQLRSVAGPYIEFLGVSSFVLILVLFMLVGRDQLADRIVGLFGNRQVSLTTRTMQEIGQRISRYLATFALVNSGFGLVIGLGLAAIGVPFAELWGCLAAMLRFIPYVGPAVAFILPLVFSFAHFPGWIPPLEVVALFAVVEAALTSFLEPVIYGKTTGVSALGLLVAAMFWTWLWGTTGLLLSTPLTVCLAVLGKYVPSLWFFAALLNEEADLEPDVRFYQRLVALDREGAIDVVEKALKERPRVEVFDQILVPALSRSEHDAARDELDAANQEFVWGVVGELLDRLDDVPEVNVPALAGAPTQSPGTGEFAVGSGPVQIVGLVADDTSDSLVLRMLGQLLAPSGCSIQVFTDTDSTLELAERVADEIPQLVIVSHLPPGGLALARYLVRRMRAHFAALPIVVGRWGDRESSAGPTEQLTAAGASRVVFSLADARTAILNQVLSQKQKDPVGAALPS